MSLVKLKLARESAGAGRVSTKGLPPRFVSPRCFRADDPVVNLASGRAALIRRRAWTCSTTTTMARVASSSFVELCCNVFAQSRGHCKANTRTKRHDQAWPESYPDSLSTDCFLLLEQRPRNSAFRWLAGETWRVPFFFAFDLSYVTLVSSVWRYFVDSDR
jgi:hypothetical protein